jgi:hypothetical protein
LLVVPQNGRKQPSDSYSSLGNEGRRTESCQGRKRRATCGRFCRPWRDSGPVAMRYPPINRVGYFLSPSGLRETRRQGCQRDTGDAHEQVQVALPGFPFRVLPRVLIAPQPKGWLERLGTCIDMNHIYAIRLRFFDAILRETSLITKFRTAWLFRRSAGASNSVYFQKCFQSGTRLADQRRECR